MSTLEMGLALVALGLLALGHCSATKWCSGSRGLRIWLKSLAPGGGRRDHQRFREELHCARVHMLKSLHGVVVHVVFLSGLAIGWKWIQDPCLGTFCQVLATWAYYVLHLTSSKIRTEGQFMRLQALLIFIHVLFVIGTARETDLVMFDVAEKVCTIGAVYLMICLIDVKVILPVYACQSALLLFCRWNLIGFAGMTPFILCASLSCSGVVGGLAALCVHHIRSDIAAKMDYGEASSLMLGFRQILRGVCDGDLLLDRCTMTIVDDANCLERVLKSSRSFRNTNFLDLFLDAQSRERFTQFLAAEASSHSESGIPRGLRVSLQDPLSSAKIAVSLDLFHTSLPGWRGSSEFCLLAIKEDPEHSSSCAPPEAPDAVPLPLMAPDGQEGRSPARLPSKSRSSISELLVAYDDLVEMALLVSDATEFLDIEEVHLSFQRQSEVSNIESGMPTLRRFIRPFDWDRIEKMFDIVTNLPEADRHERCYFRRPTLFRVPGESRSYLCARSTSLRLADPCVQPGRATHYWMHLTQFDSSQIQRPREQELEGIHEEQSG